MLNLLRSFSGFTFDYWKQRTPQAMYLDGTVGLVSTSESMFREKSVNSRSSMLARESGILP